MVPEQQLDRNPLHDVAGDSPLAPIVTTYLKRVVVCLDSDEAGRIGRDDCLMRLGRQMFVRSVDLPEGEQPDTIGRDELVMLLMKPRGVT